MERKMEKQKVAVFFPGNMYHVKAPLFYFADLVLVHRGYKVIELSYEHVSENQEDWIQATREQFLTELTQEGIADAAEIVFVSKSIGTVIAGWISARLGRAVKNVFYSPLRGTLPFMKSEDCIVFAGTKDRLFDARELEAFCRENQIDATIFEGAGHAIVNREDPEASVRILDEIVRKLDEYVSASGQTE